MFTHYRIDLSVFYRYGGHLIDWDGVEVIDSHSDTFQRCVVEGWHIVRQHHPLNRDQSQLPQVYRQLACC